MPSKQARKWCATFYTEPPDKQPDGVRYAIYGKETCPTTHKLHWQSYIEFDKRMTVTGIKNLYADTTVHLEITNGTRDQARTYCQKDNEWEEVGDWESGGQGARTDIKAFVQKLKDGNSLKDTALEEPQLYCRYRNGLKDINNWVIEDQLEDWRDIEIWLFHGPTGTGKTKQAMAEATYKIKGKGLDWWQDYTGQKIICIDDYNNDLKITELLGLLDGYKLRLNVKGSHAYAQWTKVFITTNLTVGEIHANAKARHREALFRRISEHGGGIKEFFAEDQEMEEEKEETNNNKNQKERNHKKDKRDGEWVSGFFFPYDEQ